MTSKFGIAAVSLLGIVFVGYIDFITGIELRVFPLYFLPLLLATWFFGKTGALTASAVAAVAWAVAQYLSGRHYSQLYVWIVNFFTQGAAFTVVSLLIARLHSDFLRERVLSSTDHLTGLANSRSFYAQAGAIVNLCRRNFRPVSVACVDLDDFKHVNDTLGHEQGDAVLREVAEVLISGLRASDVPARIGGDEFVILLPDTAMADARVALEKVRSRLEQMPQLRDCSVTASIGVVSCGQAPTDIQMMLKMADELMYSVKMSGKNRVEARRLVGLARRGRRIEEAEHAAAQRRQAPVLRDNEIHPETGKVDGAAITAPATGKSEKER